MGTKRGSSSRSCTVPNLGAVRYRYFALLQERSQRLSMAFADIQKRRTPSPVDKRILRPRAPDKYKTMEAANVTMLGNGSKRFWWYSIYYKYLYISYSGTLRKSIGSSEGFCVTSCLVMGKRVRE